MATQPERIASLEAHRHWQWIAFSAVTIGGIAWLSWLSTTIFQLKTDIAVLRQGVNDGSKQIVSDLRPTSSPSIVKAAFSTVIAQVQTARAHNKAPEDSKVSPVSIAVADAVRKNPDLSEGWQASSELISFRTSGGNEPGEVKCDKPDQFEAFNTGVEPFDPATSQAIPLITYRNCALDIGDLEAFEHGTVGDMKRAIHKNVYFSFVLDHVHVIYRGGPVIPANAIVFSNCTFDFRVNSTPPPKGANLMEALLEARNPKEVKVKINES
jgi:hypothetical protein